MTAILATLGLALNGLDIFARVKAALAWLAIALVISGGGYVWGRVDGSALCVAKSAAVEAAIRSDDDAAQLSNDDFNRAETLKAAATDNDNEALTNVLTSPEADDVTPVLSVDWVRALHSIK